MVSIKSLSLLVLARLAIAQTPQGFIPPVVQSLYLTFGNDNTVSPAGELIPRGETANPPDVASSVFSSTTDAVLMMLDLDVERDGTRVPALHWFTANVTKMDASSSNSSLTFPPVAGQLAPYRQPSPPVGDIPHRYVFLLFSQPDGFTVPAAYMRDYTDFSNRLNFTYEAFIVETGLGSPIAANYIQVQNLTGAGNSTGTSGTSPSASTPVTSPAPMVTTNAADHLQVVGGSLFAAAAAIAVAVAL